MFSIIDAYQGYHQIWMHTGDVEKMTFRVCCGVFGFVSLPFRLKNVGATYQKMMDTIFKYQIGKNMVVYVDDIMVKKTKRFATRGALKRDLWG